MARISGNCGKERVLRVNSTSLYHLTQPIASGTLYILDPLKEQTRSIQPSVWQEILLTVYYRKNLEPQMNVQSGK